jgi:hypothetical protein
MPSALTSLVFVWNSEQYFGRAYDVGLDLFVFREDQSAFGEFVNCPSFSRNGDRIVLVGC